ncbi:MAG: choice-of-anchor L domain-containing protein [Bacteroidota bacterium]|jgi:gliding motility-associated-like protein
MKKYCYLILFFGIPLLSQGQLTTSSANTVNFLIQNVLVGSPSVYVSNVSYVGAPTARGTFNCVGACNVGIGSGMLLTTGNVNKAIGPNNNTGAGQGNNTPGDPDLLGLAPGSNSPTDAAVIQFDFMVPNDSIKFKYVWGSEEYHDYVTSNCNDVFGFFVSGPRITGKKNIALIPGTTTPISINNVNNGQSFAGPSTGPCTNCQYFVDNFGSSTIQYDGMTTVLTAGTDVCPCEVYTLKLATQDFCDPNFDSGVFFEGGSFQPSGEIPILNALTGQAIAATDTVFICPGDSFAVTLPACRNPVWSNGDTTMTLWITQPGTYYGTISNTIGTSFCFAFSTIIQVVSSIPNATIAVNGNLNLCPNDSVILTASNGTAYLWSNGATTQSIVVNNAGTYSCTVSYNGSCDAFTNPVIITQSGTPAVINTSGPLTFCSGGSVTLNAAAAPSYQWSTGSNASSITVNSSGTYTLTVSDNGCIANSSVNVFVNPNPTPLITGPINSCPGFNVQLSTGAYSNYLWSTGVNTSTLNTTTSGTFTVTVTDANGCTGQNSHVVNFYSAPTPSISGGLQICAGNNSTLSSNGIYSQYLWNNGSSSSSISVNTSGPYTLTVTDNNNCTASTTVNFTVNPLPIASISGATVICNGTNTTFTASPAGLNYLWNNGATSNSINVSNAGNYSVTVTDNNGCSNQANTQLTVTNNPTPIITGLTTACQGQSVLLDAGSYAGYSWSNGTTSQTISVTSSGTYTVTVTINGGCTGSASQQITINPLPTPTISGTLAICAGLSTQLSSSLAYSNYQWSTGANSNSITAATPGNYGLTVTDNNGCSGSTSVQLNNYPLPTPTLPASVSICAGDSTSLSPGNYSNYSWNNGLSSSSIYINTAGLYIVEVTDANGCKNSDTTTLTVNNLPNPVITGPSSTCINIPAALNAGSGYSQYLWSTGEPTSTIQTNVGGNYIVTVTDIRGCKNTANFNLTVYPLADLAITGDKDICEGESTIITGIPGQGTYLWSTGETTPAINLNQTGIYTLTITTNNGCISSSSYSVNVHPNPKVNYSYFQKISCESIGIQIVNSSTFDQGSVFTWTFGDGNGGNGATPSHVYADTGSYMTTCVITSPWGCTGIDSLTVQLNTPPLPEAGFIKSNAVVSIFNSEVQFLNKSKNATNYKWSFGDDQSSTDANPTHKYDRVGTHVVKLIAYNDASCYDEYEETIEVVQFFVPNSFTPNNDGKNDVFFDGTPAINVNSYNMKVINRLGGVIYESDSYYQPWDGNMPDGTPAPEGVFAYVIHILSENNKVYDFKGTFSLIR